ncbi:MAG TPA: glycosyltransferase family 2 protein [Caldilineaceae bacterium]|nr:glycosyltransferase family 2 protein [Caldilineaceae bacterium]
MQVSVVILNWNAAQDTIRCARQISAWQQLTPRVWIVDNGSSEDHLPCLHAFLRDELPNGQLIRNVRNLGFSGGTNRGIEAALRHSDAPILLLNNDATIAEADMFRLLAALDSDPTIGVVGPVILDAEQETVISAGNKDLVWRHQNAIRTPPPAAVSVAYVSGAVALVRAKLFREVGLLDEHYFFNVEIADLCRRARQHGYRTVVEPAARAYHNLNRSSVLRDTLYTYYIIRNRFLYIRKFYRGLRLPLTGFWALYSWLLAWKVQWAGNPGSAQAIRMGLGDGLRGRFGGQNERVLAACTRGAKQFPS